jgi:hypothetical protein
MLRLGALEQLTEPGALRSGIAREVQYDGDALRQERTHVWPKRVLQSGGALDESRNVSDLAGKQVIQELVLNKENGMFSARQVSRERGLSRRHLAAQEDQLRRDGGWLAQEATR